MRTPKKRGKDQLDESEGRPARPRRKTPATKSGVPRLSLWECGIGAVWK